MRKITHYYIVWGKTSSDLFTKVSREMKFNWEPQGGVSISSDGTFYQVMVQYNATLATRETQHENKDPKSRDTQA